ncbi:cation diffusion facilitator family transporter [Arcanobacterium hippocoleae]
MQKQQKSFRTNADGKSADLTRFAWISIAAAIVTIATKLGAYLLVGSVSLLSDAMESVVNLVAAVVALVSLKIAAKPADSSFTFGRSKAEYFSAAVEGAMIFGAAALILFSAIERILHPVTLNNFGIGLLISAISAGVNLIVGIYLIRSGQKYSSPALTADGKHLLTDVITTAGVLLGVALIWLTGWEILDPIFAVAVALNIIYIGIGLIRTALAGLLDVTLPSAENTTIIEILHTFQKDGVITFHGLQTRVSGRARYVNLDMQVPDDWTVKAGHDLAMQIEAAIQNALENCEVAIHIEPISDPASYEDIPCGYVPLMRANDAIKPPAQM